MARPTPGFPFVTILWMPGVMCGENLVTVRKGIARASSRVWIWTRSAVTTIPA